MVSPWLVPIGHAHLDVACPHIVRPCINTYVAFFLGEMETLEQLDGILHVGHMEVGSFLESK